MQVLWSDQAWGAQGTLPEEVTPLSTGQCLEGRWIGCLSEEKEQLGCQTGGAVEAFSARGAGVGDVGPGLRPYVEGKMVAGG